MEERERERLRTARRDVIIMHGKHPASPSYHFVFVVMREEEAPRSMALGEC